MKVYHPPTQKALDHPDVLWVTLLGSGATFHGRVSGVPPFNGFPLLLSRKPESTGATQGTPKLAPPFSHSHPSKGGGHVATPRTQRCPETPWLGQKEGEVEGLSAG